MAMAAAPKASAKTRAEISLWTCFLFFIIAVATVSNPNLVKAGGSSRPSKLTIYVHAEDNSSNSTVVVEPPAPALASPIPSGSVFLVNNVLREGAAPDSLQVGFSLGINAAVGDKVFFSNVYTLTIGYSGSISIQGEVTEGGVQEVAVTGGTGVFRFARGYLDSTAVSFKGDTPIVFMSTFYLKYD